MLRTHPPAAWDTGALDRYLANLDQAAWSLGLSGLPTSKSGAPLLPPPPPQVSITPEQWRAVPRFLAPNLIDYFTKPLPPPAPFPSTPGKIPSWDYNPYAGGALLDTLNLALLAASILAGGEATPLALARFADEAAPGTIAKAAGTAGSGPLAASILDRAALRRLNAELGPLGQEAVGSTAANQAAKAATDAQVSTPAGEQILTGAYGKLSGALPKGWQANHLNQDRVYQESIPPSEGLSVSMRGNILTEPGTPHYNYHRSLEQFWDQYRKDGSLESEMPTNAEYGEAVRRALIAAGLSPAQASDLAAQAAQQRIASGLVESKPVPRIPVAIWRRRRN
ncbi:MAG TPA: hypothetical protein VIY51_14385 [Xanthobacteraceae bacterium]